MAPRITPEQILALKRQAERPNYGSAHFSPGQLLAVILAYESERELPDVAPARARRHAR